MSGRGALERAAAALGRRVERATPLGGGDTSDAWHVRLDDGRSVFVKTDDRDVAGIFDAEADGLARLAATDTVRVPEVLAVADDGPERFVALAWIDQGRPGPGHDDELGRSLAALHRCSAPRFGLDRDNFLGRRRQQNPWCDTFAELYGRHRLEPMARLSHEAGRLSEASLAAVERLVGRLPELVGPPEPPALVHGDLWAGNAIADATGRPWLVDPAVSYSHREVDLAMMQLFGGFGPRVFAAYDEAFPRAEGHGDRVALFQLYPLLVHTLHPSPSGYLAAVDRAVSRYL